VVIPEKRDSVIPRLIVRAEIGGCAFSIKLPSSGVEDKCAGQEGNACVRKDLFIVNLDLARYRDDMLGVMRIVAGIVYFSEGTASLFGYPHGNTQRPPFHLMTEMGIGAVLETFGGLAITLGLLTRPVAFILSGEMAVAYFQFHFPASIFPTVNGGMAAILYCFFYLYLVFAGAGSWSIDAVIARSRQQLSPAGYKREESEAG